MLRSLLSLSLVFAAALPTATSAADLGYSYVEADYLDYSDGLDGFGLRASWALADSGFYALADYQRLQQSVLIGNPINGRIDIDGNLWQLGVGYRLSVNDRTDVLFEGGYQSLDNDFADADGYRVGLGMRSAWTTGLEGRWMLSYREYDFDDSDLGGGGDVSLNLGLHYKLNPTWGLLAEAELFDYGDHALLFGVRARFD